MTVVMPTERRLFNPDLYYHVYNCGVEKRSIFETDRDYQRFLDATNYYLYDQRISYAQFQDLPIAAKQVYIMLNPKGLEKLRVKLLSYCLMPNHFHLLLKPAKEKGITRFISDISNSYTRYFNIKNERLGALFQGAFKAKEISSEGSLLQISRYIHLNPVVSSKTNPEPSNEMKPNEMKPESYPFSSYKYWITEPPLDPSGLEIDYGEIAKVLDLAGGTRSYKEFVEAKLTAKPELGIEELLIE